MSRPKLLLVNAGRLDWSADLDWSAVSHDTQLFRYEDSSPSPLEIAARATAHQATILVTKEVVVDLSLLPSCVKLVVEAGTGHNNIVDAEGRESPERGIAVCNVPGYSTDAVAQLVATHLLSFSSSLVQQQRALASGDRSHFASLAHVPLFELAGKTLGLVGAGAIATSVARLAAALGMRVVVWSRSARDGPLWQAAPTLHSLLAQSDFVSLHCPLTPDTQHMLGAVALSHMKRSAYLINTARGAIIDEAALIQALRAGALAGAALDVTDPEPPAADSPLWTLPGVVLTPHIGWKRRETRQRLVNEVGLNVSAFLSGQPRNLV